jgi:hypothetical protein
VTALAIGEGLALGYDIVQEARGRGVSNVYAVSEILVELASSSMGWER